MGWVRLYDVTTRFEQRLVLHHVFFRLEAGERVGLIGRNGTGKTTLLRLILGQAEPTEGEVLEQGLQVVQHRPNATGGLGDEGVDELQVADEQPGITEPVGRRRRGRQQQLDHGPGGLRCQCQRGGGQFGDHVQSCFLHRGYEVGKPISNQQLEVASQTDKSTN